MDGYAVFPGDRAPVLERGKFARLIELIATGFGAWRTVYEAECYALWVLRHLQHSRSCVSSMMPAWCQAADVWLANFNKVRVFPAFSFAMGR